MKNLKVKIDRLIAILNNRGGEQLSPEEIEKIKALEEKHKASGEYVSGEESEKLPWWQKFWRFIWEIIRDSLKLLILLIIHLVWNFLYFVYSSFSGAFQQLSVILILAGIVFGIIYLTSGGNLNLAGKLPPVISQAENEAEMKPDSVAAIFKENNQQIPSFLTPIEDVELSPEQIAEFKQLMTDNGISNNMQKLVGLLNDISEKTKDEIIRRKIAFSLKLIAAEEDKESQEPK